MFQKVCRRPKFGRKYYHYNEAGNAGNLAVATLNARLCVVEFVMVKS